MRVRLDPPPYSGRGVGAVAEVPPAHPNYKPLSGLGFTYPPTPLARGVYFRTLARRGGTLPPTATNGSVGQKKRPYGESPLRWWGCFWNGLFLVYSTIAKIRDKFDHFGSKKPDEPETVHFL